MPAAVSEPIIPTAPLTAAIRDALRTSAYVSHSRAGEPREGGDGVTIVWLK